MPVPEPDLKDAAPAPLDPQLLESLKQLPEVTNVIEIELAMLPMPVREKKDRPFFPYLLMLADASSGAIVGSDMLQPLPSLDAMRAELPTKVAEHLLQFGARPLKIAVGTETTARSLAQLASELGVRIKLSPNLPALDSAMEYMGRMFR
jgi:hypothetical protein